MHALSKLFLHSTTIRLQTTYAGRPLRFFNDESRPSCNRAPAEPRGSLIRDAKQEAAAPQALLGMYEYPYSYIRSPGPCRIIMVVVPRDDDSQRQFAVTEESLRHVSCKETCGRCRRTTRKQHEIRVLLRIVLVVIATQPQALARKTFIASDFTVLGLFQDYRRMDQRNQPPFLNFYIRKTDPPLFPRL